MKVEVEVEVERSSWNSYRKNEARWDFLVLKFQFVQCVKERVRMPLEFEFPVWLQPLLLKEESTPYRRNLFHTRCPSKMAFRKFVETGRVVFVAEGPDEGKLCTIVNIIDQNRVLVDGPETGITRQEMSIKKLHLTTLSLKFPFTAPTRLVRKAWKEADINKQWEASRWAQRVTARKIRQNLNDFERFKLNSARRTRNKLRRNVYLSLLTKAKKSGGLKHPKSRNGKKSAKKAPAAKATGGKKK